jgi:sarcosine oxidase, subunit alpha
MARGNRTRPLSHRVILTFDGEPLEAERGEPLAAALLAADKRIIARSPKFHRPRGPACMRGACDGCLARVNETPNTMTCMTPAEEGMVVVSQNRLGPRDADLLRMTDWFFPDGMNHHELFAGVPGIQSIMQGFARRVAGLGRLPGRPEPPRSAARRNVDVVVVGAGPSGMAVAARLASAGRAVEVLDDQLAPGGGVTALSTEDAARFEDIRTAFDAKVAAGQIRLRSRTVAAAVYGRDLLVVGEEVGAEVVEAQALVLACGAHDGALAFEGNDVPGVMSARAAGWLLHHGVIVGKRIAVVIPGGGGPFGESFARAASGLAKVEVVHGEPIAIRGASAAKGVRVRTVGKKDLVEDRTIDADAVLIDAPRSPAYELCQQAGASLVHDSRGFIVQTENGRVGDARNGIWAVGEVCGVAFEAGAVAANAALVAAQIASA